MKRDESQFAKHFGTAGDALKQLDNIGEVARVVGSGNDEFSDAARKAESLDAAVNNTRGITETTQMISTPYGDAFQDFSNDALRIRKYVDEVGELYRGGKIGRLNTADAQFWAPETPFSASYGKNYGVDFSELEFIMGGKLKEGQEFITRGAPGLGNNPGGAIEVVTDPNAIKIDFFHMP